MPGLTIELIADPEAGGYTTCLPDVPAYGAGPTEEEAIADLREALQAYIQAQGLDEIMRQVVRPELREATWDLRELADGGTEEKPLKVVHLRSPQLANRRDAKRLRKQVLEFDPIDKV